MCLTYMARAQSVMAVEAIRMRHRRSTKVGPDLSVSTRERPSSRVHDALEGGATRSHGRGQGQGAGAAWGRARTRQLAGCGLGLGWVRT